MRRLRMCFYLALGVAYGVAIATLLSVVDYVKRRTGYRRGRAT